MYSSLGRFYQGQHPGLGHPLVGHPFAPHPHHFSPHHPHQQHSMGNIPENPSGLPSGPLADMKPEIIPNPLQSLREVKVPGYPTFDAPSLSSTSSSSSSNNSG